MRIEGDKLVVNTTAGPVSLSKELARKATFATHPKGVEIVTEKGWSRVIEGETLESVRQFIGEFVAAQEANK